MAKECVSCNDQVEYSHNQGKCPKCGDFLRIKQMGENEQQYMKDEFEDIVFNQFSSNYNEFYRNENQYDESKSPPFLNSNTMNGEKESAMERLKNKKRGSSMMVEGQVLHFREEVLPSSFLKRWFSSFFKGIPYSNDSVINSFQLYQDREGYEILLFGRIIQGKIADGNDVKVYGKRNRYNSIIARSVVNLNSNAVVVIHAGINSFFVRLITILVTLLLCSCIYFVITFNWISFIEYLADKILEFLLAVFLEILPIIIVLWGLWWMIKKLFR